MSLMTPIETVVEDVIGRVQKEFDRLAEDLSKMGDDKITNNFRKSGYSIFYSNPLDTLQEGQIYFLGLNPGGSPDGKYKPYNLTEFRTKRNWNAFINDNWSQKGRTYEDGKAPLQKRVCEILEAAQNSIGANPDAGRVFATNLYFFRSRDQATLARYGIKQVDCWDFHVEFLNRVKPKIVLCNGNSEALSPYKSFRSKYFDSREEKEEIETLRGSPGSKGYLALKIFRIKRPTWGGVNKALVVGIPHMSRYNPDHRMKDLLGKKLSEILP